MTEIIEVPSPFCGIGADDLTVQVEGLKVSVVKNGCAVTTPLFEQPVTDTSPRIDGVAVDLPAAAARAAALLKAGRQPVIGGCATDVNGMRALLALADRTGAVVDNMNFSNARNNILALQDSGWMNTTLAEVKNRCDLLLAVGTDVEAFAPRFFERYLWADDALFLPDPKQRTVVYLGRAPSGAGSTSPDGQTAQVLACEQNALPEVVAALRALLKDRPVQAETVAGLAIGDLRALAARLKAASYGVVAWAAGALNYAHAELTVQMLSSLIKDVNARGARCSGLPLAGREGDQTASQVAGWITGYPARVRFSRGFPEYDPYLNDSLLLLASGEADVLVWVQAFNADSAPPAASLPTIVVGRSGMRFEQEPAVFIPVGTPGIDHAGHAYRMDNVVAIRLKKLRESGLPSTAEALAAIEQAL